MLGYPFRAMAVLYDRFRRRCPTVVRGLSLHTFGREVCSLGFPKPTVGAATAIGWWKCSGCLAYVMMESVREKEEKEGRTAAIVGAFVLPERKKVEMLFLTSPYFVYLCTKPRSIYLFCQTNYYAFFSSTRFLEFVYARPVRSCEL